jgi:hypothetical protein
LKSALHKLIAAALAVGLWPYFLVGLAEIVAYLNSAPNYEGPDDFWPEVRYFRLFVVCSVILAWVTRSIFDKLRVKRVILTSYIGIYILFVMLLSSDQQYLGYERLMSGLYGGLFPISMIFVYDLIHRISDHVLLGLGSR